MISLITAGDELVEMNKLFPELKCVYAGSLMPGGGQGSALRQKSEIHYLPGLSYREFLDFKYRFGFQVIHLDELLELNRNPGAVVLNRIRPLEFFDEFIRRGFYTVEYDSEADYNGRMVAMINALIDSDLSSVYNLDNISGGKIRRLLMRLSEGGLFRPNIEKLARGIDTTRDSLLKFIDYAVSVGLIRIIYTNSL